MNIHRLILCAHRKTDAGDAMTELRVLLRDVYAGNGPERYRFLFVVNPSGLLGFDRLVVPLGYARILGDLTDAPVVMAAPGTVVTIVTADGPRPSTVIGRLREVTPVSEPPRLRLLELPMTLPTALAMLDEVCE